MPHLPFLRSLLIGLLILLPLVGCAARQKPASAVDRAELARKLDAALGKLKESGATYSARVIALPGGDELYRVAPDEPYLPASNMKLLTAAAALQVLGADYTFTTTASALAVDGGVIGGDLYLVGGGDPLLHTPDWDGALIGYPVSEGATDLDELAGAIVAAGVTQISGRVLGDGSRYDDQLYQDEWGDDIRVLEAGPLSALMVNDSRLLSDSGEFRSHRGWRTSRLYRC